jgi:hypothetical protein
MYYKVALPNVSSPVPAQPGTPALVLPTAAWTICFAIFQETSATGRFNG